MTVVESIIESVENLPAKRQRELLNFAEYLEYKEKSNGGKPQFERNVERRGHFG